MDKGINIRSVLLLKKAVEILDYLGTKYDIEKLRKRPDICKEIIVECIRHVQHASIKGRNAVKTVYWNLTFHRIEVVGSMLCTRFLVLAT